MRVAIYTADFVAVAFQVPIAEFHTAASLERHRSVQNLGPDVLGAEFDEAAAAARIRSNPAMEVGEALLRQSIVAGIGNVFKSEVCFAGGVNPFRSVQEVTDAELLSLMTHARKFLQANVTDESGMRRTTGRANDDERLWVYKRAGEPCRKCGTAILSRKQGLDARVTFWCPQCQP
jgi:endonuclease-8